MAESGCLYRLARYRADEPRTRPGSAGRAYAPSGRCRFDAVARLRGVEADLVFPAVDPDVREADFLQSAAEGVGVDGDEHIVDVPGSDDVEITRVRPDEHAAWAKDAVQLGKEAVLEVSRGNVMEHGEACGCREAVRGKSCVGGVALNDVHIRAG